MTLFRSLFVTALVCASGLGQSPDTGGFRGQVTDARWRRGLGRERGCGRARATTDSQGQYVIADLPLTGAYSIRFSLTGFSGEQGGPLHLRAGETPVVNAVLKPEGSRSQLTVFGSAEGIRSDSPELGNRLDLAKLENTPILGRKLSNTPLVDSAVRPARAIF